MHISPRMTDTEMQRIIGTLGGSTARTLMQRITHRANIAREVRRDMVRAQRLILAGAIADGVALLEQCHAALDFQHPEE